LHLKIKDMSGFGFGNKPSSATGTGFILITDAGIITTITNDANWNPDYTGSIVGLVEGNYYFDSTTNQNYQFLNSVLTRTTVNTLI